MLSLINEGKKYLHFFCFIDNGAYLRPENVYFRKCNGKKTKSMPHIVDKSEYKSATKITL